MELTESDIKRFWSKADRSGDCWEWTAGKHSQGYGMFGISGKTQKAHRVSWTLTHSPIPPGMCVLHACDNTSCVNPEHLFLGTQLDNIKDRDEKGRAAKGKDQGLSKLTEQQVTEIRAKYIPWKYTLRRLAKEYGVDYTSIYQIIHWKIWTHI